MQGPHRPLVMFFRLRVPVPAHASSWRAFRFLADPPSPDTGKVLLRGQHHNGYRTEPCRGRGVRRTRSSRITSAASGVKPRARAIRGPGVLQRARDGGSLLLNASLRRLRSEVGNEPRSRPHSIAHRGPARTMSSSRSMPATCAPRRPRRSARPTRTGRPDDELVISPRRGRRSVDRTR
jgi:hypothetical protein